MQLYKLSFFFAETCEVIQMWHTFNNVIYSSNGKAHNNQKLCTYVFVSWIECCVHAFVAIQHKTMTLFHSKENFIELINYYNELLQYSIKLRSVRNQQQQNVGVDFSWFEIEGHVWTLPKQLWIIYDFLSFARVYKTNHLALTHTNKHNYYGKFIALKEPTKSKVWQMLSR